MSTYKTRWQSVFVLISFAVSAGFLFLISAGLSISSLADLFGRRGDPAGQMIEAFAYGFEFLVVSACFWFVLPRAMGRLEPPVPFKFPYADWQIFFLLAIVFLSILFGTAAAVSKIAWVTWFVLPGLTLLIIVPPIWLLFGIGTKGIELGPRWRIFTVLGMGMTVGPAIMIVLELVVLISIFIASVVFIVSFQPGLIRELTGLSGALQHETNPDQMLILLTPYLKNPVVVVTVLGYIAVIIPLIEEFFKPLAVWVFARKLSSPAEGFAMGILSGGAFALIESLNASGDGSLSWAAIVSLRAGTSLLHMTSSGLVGWGITSLIKEKRVGRFFAAYLSAASIHGIWNACAIGSSFSSLGPTIGKADSLAYFLPALLCGMLVLGVGMLAVLIASNRKLRSPWIAGPNEQSQPDTPPR